MFDYFYCDYEKKYNDAKKEYESKNQKFKIFDFVNKFTCVYICIVLLVFVIFVVITKMNIGIPIFVTVGYLLFIAVGYIVMIVTDGLDSVRYRNRMPVRERQKDYFYKVQIQAIEDTLSMPDYSALYNEGGIQWLSMQAKKTRESLLPIIKSETVIGVFVNIFILPVIVVFFTHIVLNGMNLVVHSFKTLISGMYIASGVFSIIYIAIYLSNAVIKMKIQKLDNLESGLDYLYLNMISNKKVRVSKVRKEATKTQNIGNMHGTLCCETVKGPFDTQSKPINVDEK